MEYPSEMKAKFVKKVLAAAVSLSIGFGLPSRGYSILAADMGKAADAPEAVPAVSMNLNSYEPALSQTILDPVGAGEIEVPVGVIFNQAGEIQERAVSGGLKASERGAALSMSFSPAISPAFSKSRDAGIQNGGGIKGEVRGAGIFSAQDSLGQNVRNLDQIYDGENAVSSKIFAKTARVGKIGRAIQSGLKKAAVVGGALGVSVAAAVPAYAQAVHGNSAAHWGLASLAAVWPLVATGAYWISMGSGFEPGPESGRLSAR